MHILRLMPPILLCACQFVSLPTRCAEAQPVASNRPDVTRLLQLLTNIDGIVIGQNIGHSNENAGDGFHRSIVQLEKATGHAPALMGLDYGYDFIPVSLKSSNRYARQFHESGGIVSISMHPPNPWHRSQANDINVGRFSELTTPGTVAHRRWRESLDRVAGGLTELRDAGVVVLWRPLHEMNGGWFWWCPKRNGNWPSRSQFRTLWRDMFDYFTHEKKLDNLLWVFSAAVRTEAQQLPATYFYPGDRYVDIVGLDWYTDDNEDLDHFLSYTRLAALGKPLGLTEFGPNRRNGSFDNRSVITFAQKYPKLKFVLYWHSWPGNRMAIIDQRNAAELMQHHAVIDRNEFKSEIQEMSTTSNRAQ